MNDSLVTLPYERQVRRRRRWITVLSVLVATLATLYYFRAPLLASADARYRAWQLNRAERRVLAASPKPGELVFCTDLKLAPPAERSRFIDQTDPRLTWLTHFYRPWMRRLDEWGQYHRLSQSMPMPKVLSGLGNFPAYRLPVSSNSGILSVRPITTAEGTAMIELVALTQVGTDRIGLTIHLFPSASAALGNPLRRPNGLSDVKVSWWPEDGPVALRIIPPTASGSVVAFEVAQAGTAQKIELSESSGTYRVDLNGEPPRKMPGDTFTRAGILLPRPPKPIDRLPSEVLTKIPSASWPQTFFCSKRRSVLMIDPGNQRVIEILVDAPTNQRIMSLPGPKLQPRSAIYDPVADQLGWFTRGMTPADTTLWTGPTSDLSRSAQVMHPLPMSNPIVRYLSDGRFVVTGYRDPVQAFDRDGTVVWKNPLELHKGLATGKSLVVTRRNNPDSLLFCDVQTGRTVREVSIWGGTEESLALSPDETMVAMMWSGRSIPTVFDALTGEVIAALPAGVRANDVCFSPDGRWAAFSGRGFALVDLHDHRQPKYYVSDVAPGYGTNLLWAASFDERSDAVYFISYANAAVLKRIKLPPP